jgi:hypothetical protein
MRALPTPAPERSFFLILPTCSDEVVEASSSLANFDLLERGNVTPNMHRKR